MHAVGRPPFPFFFSLYYGIYWGESGLTKIILGDNESYEYRLCISWNFCGNEGMQLKFMWLEERVLTKCSCFLVVPEAARAARDSLKSKYSLHFYLHVVLGLS